MNVLARAITKPRELQNGPLRVWVSFEIAGQRYAVDIRRVREVLSTTAVEKVPTAPPLVVGVLNLRGRIVTVFNLHLRLGSFAPPYDGGECCVIVVDVDGEPIALRVDRITDLCSVSEGSIKAPPKVAAAGLHTVVQGVVNVRGELLTLLDIDTLLDVD